PGDAIRYLLQGAALCNDATLERTGNAWTIAGDPTEGALVVAAEKAGIRVPDLRERFKRLDVLPFESENQFMATLHEAPGETPRLWVKGAPEVVLEHCKDVPADVQSVLDRMTEAGQRVLAVAESDAGRVQDGLTLEAVGHDLRFVGLIAMIDPPRSE